MPPATDRGQIVPAATDTSTEGSVDPLRGDPPTRRDALVGALVALATVVVAWVWRSPVVPVDPWHYVQRALHFPDQVWIPLGYTRYGIILPNIVPAKLFGNAEVTYYFWQVISIAVLSAAVYLIGRRWWGPVAGLVAVVVLFSNSIVFYNLTRQYPDVMSAALLMAALFAVLQARDREFRGPWGILWLLLAGFFTGWSFEVRETALFFWPVLLLLLWRRGARPVRTTLVALVPVAAWASLDVGISAVAYGEPLLKAKALFGYGAAAKEYFAEDAKTRLDYLLAIPTTAWERPDGVWIVATGVIAILAVLVRNWPLRVMSLSLTWLLLVNLAAGGVLSPSLTLGDLYNTRYWIQYVPSIALVVGGLAGLLTRWLVARVRARTLVARTAVATLVGALAVAVPLADSVRTVPTIEAYAHNGGDGMELLARYLGAEGYRTNTVWTDVRTVRMLPIYQRPFWGGDRTWTGQAKKLDDIADVRPGDSVLLYSAYDNTCFHCKIQIQPWLEKHPVLPASWRLVYESPTRNVQLYAVS